MPYVEAQMQTAGNILRTSGDSRPEHTPLAMGCISLGFQPSYSFPIQPVEEMKRVFDEKKRQGRGEESRSGGSYRLNIPIAGPDATPRVPARDSHGFQVVHAEHLPPDEERDNRLCPHSLLEANPPKADQPAGNHVINQHMVVIPPAEAQG